MAPATTDNPTAGCGSDTATSVLFVASVVALVVNIAAIIAIRLYISLSNNQAAGTELVHIDTVKNVSKPTKTTVILIGLISLVVGLRHLLRVAAVDDWAKKSLIPKDPIFYRLIFIGTLMGGVSFTLSAIGAQAYLLTLIPYFAIYITLTFLVIYRSRKLLEGTAATEDSASVIFDQGFTIVTDLLLVFAVYQFWQLLSGIQVKLDIGLALIVVSIALCVFIEFRMIYMAPLQNKIKNTRQLLKV